MPAAPRDLRPLGGRATGVAIVASATLLVAAFPPVGLGLLGFVMFAPLVAALEGRTPREAFLLTYVCYAAAALGVVRWLVHPLVVEYQLAAAPAWISVVLLVALYALPGAAAGGLHAALRPRVAPAAAPLVFAALFALGEWLRSEPLGLPWLLAAHALADHPLWLQPADTGGAYAVSFLVVAAGAGLGVAAARRSPAPLVLPVVLVAAAAAYGALRLGQAAPKGDAIRIGVVQAAVPQAQRFQPGSAERNTLRHVALSRELVAREPVRLLVWSETAVDTDLDRSPALLRRLVRLADDAGVPLVTGAPRSADGRRTNGVVLIAPGAGLAASYDKQMLVPFSEYDPAYAPLVEPLLGAVMKGDPYERGREATVLRAGPLAIATPICFEITYPRLVRRFRARGADLLVNVSNDAWFGRTGYARMHFAHAVFRAIELRTWVVRAANTGISGAIDPAGRVAVELAVFEEGTFSVDVRRAGAPPLYARAGNAPVLLALVAVIAAAAAGRRRRGRRGARA